MIAAIVLRRALKRVLAVGGLGVAAVCLVVVVTGVEVSGHYRGEEPSPVTGQVADIDYVFTCWYPFKDRSFETLLRGHIRTAEFVDEYERALASCYRKGRLLLLGSALGFVAAGTGLTLIFLERRRRGEPEPDLEASMS